MMFVRFIINLLNLLIIGVLLTALSACDSSMNGGEGLGAETQTTSTASNFEVRIGRLICGGHLPLAIVEKRFQDQFTTFRLKTIQNHDWMDLIEDLKSADLAGTFILSPLAMKLIRDGLPAKIVLTANHNGNGFVLSEKIPNIKTLKDMKTIIAVPHLYSQHNVLLHIALQKHSIPLEKVSIVGMPPRDMINSLRRGEIDGFVVGEPEANKSVELGIGWMASISPEIWKDHMDHVFLASNQFIEQHPEQLQELVTALVQGGKFIEANPHVAALMGEDYTGSSAAVFEKVLTTPSDWIDYNDMVPTINEIHAMGQQLVEMGYWKSLPDNLQSFIDTRFVNLASMTK